MHTNKSKQIMVAILLLIGLGVAGCDGNGAKGLAGVDKNGNLLRGVNVASVTRHLPGYVVEFTSDVDVANGYYLVTPGFTNSCNSRPNAEKWSGNSVYVSFSSGGPAQFVDCGFSLAVF